jgi:coenzyme F420 hydrogenase subunit beta
MQVNAFEKQKLDAAYYAAQSFRIRCLVDSSEDILKAGAYTEAELDKLMLAIFDAEFAKFQLWETLRGKGPMDFGQLQEYAQETCQSLFDVVSRVYKMKYEGLASIEENDGQIIQVLATTAAPDDLRPIYEQVTKVSTACSGCGMCSAICPLGCVSVADGVVAIDEGKCIHCGLCYTVCPRSYFPKKIADWLVSHGEAVPLDVQIGSYLDAYSAQTTVPEIREVGQDGGIVTTLLYFAFQAGKIEAALGAKLTDQPWKPEPFVMTSKEDAILAAGTKYANNPTLSALPQLASYANVAVVGTPCMMQALRKGDIFPIGHKFWDKVKYKIGIFCMESFSYDSIVKIAEQLGTTIENAKKMNINSGKFFIRTKDGEVLQAPVKEVTALARKECHYCYDLTSESADVSVGSIGSPEGWSSVIVRTPAGKELFEGALEAGLLEAQKLGEIEPGLPMLVKIAGIKSGGCEKRSLAASEKGHVVPAYK